MLWLPADRAFVVKVACAEVPVVGEIAIRYDNQNFLAEVTKGPSLPLVRIHAVGARPERVVVRGVLARGTWSGSPAKAPEALKAWVALPEAFHHAQARARGDNSSPISLADTKVDTTHSGGKVTSIEIERDGQRIICRLDR